MDYETFTRTAPQRAGLPEPTVERLDDATHRTLGGRISGVEARGVLSQLPQEYRERVGPWA
jgi:hypothetical protein